MSFRPRECQPLFAPLQARVLCSCLAGPVPLPPDLLPCQRGPQGPGNGITFPSVGLGAHSCPEHRSDTRRREPLSGLMEGKRAGSPGHQEAQKVLQLDPSLAQTPPGIASCPEKVSFLSPEISSSGFACPSYFWGDLNPQNLQPVLCISGANVSLVEQRPRWAMVRRGQAKTLSCFLRDAQYPWMSWYQQDLQGQLQVLASLRFSGDKDDVSLPGADYQVTRVDDKELRLQVANVTQGRTLYCTCSKDTVRNLP